jgi:hypothetical protein
MARSGRIIVPSMLVLGALAYMASLGPVFVPSPTGNHARASAAAAAAPAAVALLGATPALAAQDEIGFAASRLTDKAYPFLKDIDWFSTLSLTKPGSAPAGEWVKAIDKAIVMGSAMDPALLKAAVQAHHAAIGGVSSTGNGVTSKADFEAINAALGRAIASVPTSKVMDVYNAFKGLVSPDVPKYLMSTVKEADAKAAYAALMDFKDVVKAKSVKASMPASSVSSAAATKIDAAAEKLSAAAYPFLKEVDWTSDLALKPLPGASPLQVLRAIDKALVMGAAMDSAALKEAADAHHNAIGSVDAKLVTSAKDFEAINAGLGKAISSVPTSTVMDVYNAFAGIVSPVIPNYLYSSVSPNDAQAAYNALLEFKDVVKAAR